jgi:hypothetical protein
VLLDGGFNVNIILESFQKKLGLRRFQLALFVVHMVCQRKVQPIGLIKNLKISLASYVYKILVIVLNMENGVEVYSMFLGRPWLKATKAHHNWGDNIVIITSKERIVILSTIKCVKRKSFERPKNLDIEFVWDEALSKKKKKEQLHNVVPELWHVGKVAPKVLYF